MKEETYLKMFLYPDELTYNIKKIIKDKLTQRYLFKEIDKKMITNIEITNLKNMPLSKSSINTLELNIPVRIDYKTYKPGDIIRGEIFSNDRDDDRVFVISYDIICEILNISILDKIKSQNHVRVRLQNIKSTNGCFYFLAEGNIIEKK